MAKVSTLEKRSPWRTWGQACWGVVGIVTAASCAGQNGSVARGQACPAALRNVQVVAEQRADDVLVHITAPPGEDPEAIMADAPMIADALMRESRTTAGPSEQARPVPGREVRITRVTDGVEMSFASNGLLGVWPIRKRIKERVARWQKGECPNFDRSIDSPDLPQSSTSKSDGVESQKRLARSNER